MNGKTEEPGITIGLLKSCHMSWFCTGHDQAAGVGATVLSGHDRWSINLSCNWGLDVSAVIVTLLTSIGKGVGFTTLTPQYARSPSSSSPNGEGSVMNISGLFSSSCSKIKVPPALAKSLTTTLSDALLLSTGTPLNNPVAFPVKVISFSRGGSSTQSQKNIVDWEGARLLGPPKIRFGGSRHWLGLTSNVGWFAVTWVTSKSPVFVTINVTVTFSPNRNILWNCHHLCT